MVNKILGKVEFFSTTATDNVPLLAHFSLFFFKATQVSHSCFSPVFADPQERMPHSVVVWVLVASCVRGFF